MMARLIDADKLLTNAIAISNSKGQVAWSEVSTIDILSAPTVDAATVVRCKDCKWLYDEMDDYCCRSHRGLVRICENSFCSYGERKDGDGNG